MEILLTTLEMIMVALIVAIVGIFIMEKTDSNAIRAVTFLGSFLAVLLICGIVLDHKEEKQIVETCKNNIIEKTIYQNSEMETVTIVQDRFNEVYYVFHTVSDNGSLSLEKVNVRNTEVLLDIEEGGQPYYKQTENCTNEIHLYKNEKVNTLPLGNYQTKEIDTTTAKSHLGVTE